MKNDINLLQKKKSAPYSGHRVALLLLFVALLAGAAYAGFTLPHAMLTATRLEARSLDEALAGTLDSGESISVLQQTYQMRSEQLWELGAIDEARADVNGHLEAIENALPTTVNLSSLRLHGTEVAITGVAASDADVAAFCLRLRESGAFSVVFLQNSIDVQDIGVTFSLLAEIPATLDISGILAREPQSTETAEEEEAS